MLKPLLAGVTLNEPDASNRHVFSSKPCFATGTRCVLLGGSTSLIRRIHPLGRRLRLAPALPMHR